MFGYHQFFIHHVHPAVLRPGHQNGGGSGGGGDPRPKQCANRGTAANSELGLCVVCSFRPKGAHLLREARDGAPGRGHAHGEDHEPRGIVWKDGHEDSDNDRHNHHRHHRDTAPGRAGVSGVPGAAEAPAEPDARRAGEATARVSPKSPMGQRGQNAPREFSLQTSPIRPARASKCVDIARIFAFSSTCSESCSISSCFGSSSSTFSHSSSYSRFFGFRGDLGSSKSDIRRRRRRGRRKVLRRVSEFVDCVLPRLTWNPPLDLQDYSGLPLGLSRVATLYNPHSRLLERPIGRTTTSALARSSRLLFPQDEEEAALPVALPAPPPGPLDGYLFPYTINISLIPVSALVQFFLSFVFHLEGGVKGVLFGGGLNGAEEERMRLITQSKFVFLFNTETTNRSDHIAVTPRKQINNKRDEDQESGREGETSARSVIQSVTSRTHLGLASPPPPYTDRSCMRPPMGKRDA
ncbi:unnamed protein product [Tuber aestivum]|uniref:Uncharacterized protein n=1 Tax=Tuber aestivum TaxID=59557 RepID=A0A292PJV5_9PEZI|nr:unnamed protein product [Tuber aestivum]